MEGGGKELIFFYSFILYINNTSRFECLWMLFQISEVFVSPFMGVFVLVPIGCGGEFRVAWIRVEMSRSAYLSDLTQSYEDLYLLV